MHSKKVKQSPLPRALASSTKAQILSKLAATRNVIKKKFQRAYMDRMKRERKLNEAFKPITKEIAALKPSKETASKPKEKQNKPNLSDSEPSSDENANQELEFRTPALKKHFIEPAKRNVDISRYDYHVMFDEDRVDNYDKPPADDLDVHLTQTVRTTGETTPTQMKWRNVPEDAREQWMRNRKRVVDFTKSPKAAKVLEADKQRIDQMIQSTSPPASHTRSKHRLGRGMKTYGSNFIPYNFNDRIIYEYFDDPNELCDRLRLLISSRMGDNTNHLQEIHSIIEELRELECIV